MITGSAARNPEELGLGFLNIHKTLMSLYSALHQGMSAIYIMLPLRSVTASLFLSLSLTPSLALSLFFSLALSYPGSIFRHDFLPQKGPRALPFPFCAMNACTFHQCHGKDRRGEAREGSRGLNTFFFFLKGINGGGVLFHLYTDRISENWREKRSNESTI